MVRALLTACVLLAALCVFQWVTLIRLEADLAKADERALRAAYEERLEDLARTIGWLDAYLRNDDGFAQPAGLCPNGLPDVDGIERWVLGVYARERAGGASDADARRRVIEAVRQAPQAFP